VKPALADSILDVLGFSGRADDPLCKLSGFRCRDWNYALSWLHDAGLALYLLQKIKDTNATSVLPTSILSCLEKNLAANQRRVANMARQFESLNQNFNRAGVKYAVVKGFSLVPLFCPDASLRHQSDLDYLIDRRSLPIAQGALEDAGYSLKKYSANEFVYLMPSAKRALLAEQQYEAHTSHAVELRLAFWDSDSHSVPLKEPEFSVDNVSTHRWQELVFPTLPIEDAFLLQVIHAFNHILTGWMRMSWLYEIEYFLNQRSTDRSLWESVERRIGDDPLLREMLIVVAGLSARLFRAPLPATSRVWAEDLRPPVRIWLDNYARTWVFGKNRADQFSLFSVAKLVLFLHQQYLSDTFSRRHLLRTRLLPWEQLFRRVRSISSNSSANSRGRGRQLKRELIRLIFHVTGGLRYLWEIPRWRRLNRVMAHSPRPASL
jgi:hypothetical protein